MRFGDVCRRDDGGGNGYVGDGGGGAVTASKRWTNAISPAQWAAGKEQNGQNVERGKDELRRRRCKRAWPIRLNISVFLLLFLLDGVLFRLGISFGPSKEFPGFGSRACEYRLAGKPTPGIERDSSIRGRASRSNHRGGYGGNVGKWGG